MEEIIDNIDRTLVNFDLTVLGLLFGALTFILGIILSEYKVKAWFHHKRVWSRMAACLMLLIAAIYFKWHIFAVIIFVLLVVLTMVCPFPHELIYLRYCKRHPKEFDNEKYPYWLITTSALLQYYNLRIKASINEPRRQETQVLFLDKAKTWDLLDFEYKRYYIPHLDVLFRIGAVKSFEEECSRLTRFDDTDHMRTFKTYLAYNEQRYEDMNISESKCKDSDKDSRLVSLLNNLCAYEASGETEKIKAVIDELVQLKQKGVAHIVLFQDLMHYYDEIIHDTTAADNLADEIENMHPAHFGDYLNLVDVAFMHYRRMENQQKINELISKIIVENEIKQQGDEQMITSIRLLNIIYDNGANWQDYSIRLFLNRARYLNSGYRVGIEFLKETLRFLRDVQERTKQGLRPSLLNEMLADFDNYSNSYLSDIEHDIAQIDNRYLYRKKELLMLKLEVLKFMAGNDLVTLRRYNDEIYNRITAMCRYNGNQREMLHFMIVHADDILTVDKQIMEDAKADFAFANSKEAIEYERLRIAYINQAENIVCKIVDILDSRDYDKTMAYYVLYVSYFYQMFGNKPRCSFFFSKFEAYNVNIKNWTIPIQDIYFNLQKYLV